jgi:hypothetical protein
VKTRWEVESAYLPGEERPIGIPLEGAPTEVPEEGTKLLLRLYYRSASGARYRTFHQLEVGPRQSVTRLDFRQEVERS